MDEQELIRFAAREHDVPEAVVRGIRGQWHQLHRAGFYTSCGPRVTWEKFVASRVRDAPVNILARFDRLAAQFADVVGHR